MPDSNILSLTWYRVGVDLPTSWFDHDYKITFPLLIGLLRILKNLKKLLRRKTIDQS